METNGSIVRIRGDLYVLPQAADLVTGVISFHAKGFAFILGENGAEDVIVPAGETGTAFHQDLVVARRIPTPPGRFRGRAHAQVIRIVKRRRSTLVGTLHKAGAFYHVTPDDPRHLHDIYVPDPAQSRLRPVPALGDKVVVRVHEWTDPHLHPEGEICERLGRTGDPNVDILGIIRKHELPTSFPSEALAEVSRFSLNPEGHAHDPGPRLDLRHEAVFTIDPDTAKDFDDAIHLKPAGPGLWEIGIHIADVSFYVRPGGALDKEARHRGNSVYLVNQVIPMLPEELSNGLCSLLPDVDRLTFSVIATMTENGRILREKICRTVIRSRRRYTYQEAFAILQHPPRDEAGHTLHQAWKLASVLRENRFNNGALDLEMPEVKVRLDDRGLPVALEKVEHDSSHQLIEEFMLLANETVARVTKNKHLPAIYRVHESPNPEKLAELRQSLLIHGIKVGDLTKRQEMQRASRAIAKHPASHALKIALLKSLKRACYRTQPLGHYGLAKTNYCHFTSPIRRYADLVVHRALLKPGERPRYQAGDLEDISVWISQTERVAAEAEQDTVRIKKLEFFQLQLAGDPPPSFEAIITDIQPAGLLVEVPAFLVTGFIHISALGRDFFIFDEKTRRLTSRKSKATHRIGGTLRVQVDKIDFARQQIDFRAAGAAPRSGGRR